MKKFVLAAVAVVTLMAGTALQTTANAYSFPAPSGDYAQGGANG